MSLQVRGMRELIDHFEKQANVKVSKTALKKAGEHVLEVERQVASSTHNKWSRGNVGVENLRKFPIRSYQGCAFIDIGIKGAKTDWDKIRGLYFNHYGFHHNKSGQYIAGSRWMDKAYEDSVEKAQKILSEEMLKELDL